jgi:hypothetical protein
MTIISGKIISIISIGVWSVKRRGHNKHGNVYVAEGTVGNIICTEGMYL